MQLKPQIYKNKGGNSNVDSFVIEDQAILVKFKDGTVYCYDYVHTGRDNVELLKKKALEGIGLNGTINRSPAIRTRYNNERTNKTKSR